MCQEVNRNFGGDFNVETEIIKSPWDEDETPKNKSLLPGDNQTSESEDMKAIAKGLAVGIMWSISGLLDEENE